LSRWPDSRTNLIASRAAISPQCSVLNHSLPGSMIWIAAADPASHVLTAQGHLTRGFCVPLGIPLQCQIRPPNRYHRVACSPGSTTNRAAGVVSTPSATGSSVRWMTFWAQPHDLSTTALGHFCCRWVVRVPLPGQPRVVGHRLALT
jgi:hypothetical protein